MTEKSGGLCQPCSAAPDLAYVACSRYDGFLMKNLNPWDVAAGPLRITEAGVFVSTFTGDSDLCYKSDILAGIPKCAPAVQKYPQS